MESRISMRPGIKLLFPLLMAMVLISSCEPNILEPAVNCINWDNNSVELTLVSPRHFNSRYEFCVADGMDQRMYWGIDGDLENISGPVSEVADLLFLDSAPVERDLVISESSAFATVFTKCDGCIATEAFKLWKLNVAKVSDRISSEINVSSLTNIFWASSVISVNPMKIVANTQQVPKEFSVIELEEGGIAKHVGSLTEVCDLASTPDFNIIASMGHTYYNVFDGGINTNRILRIIGSNKPLYPENYYYKNWYYFASRPWYLIHDDSDAVYKVYIANIVWPQKRQERTCYLSSVQEIHDKEFLELPEFPYTDVRSIAGTISHQTEKSYFLALTSGIWMVPKPYELRSDNLIVAAAGASDGNSLLFLTRGRKCDEIRCESNTYGISDDIQTDNQCDGYFCLYEGLLETESDYVKRVTQIADRTSFVDQAFAAAFNSFKNFSRKSGQRYCTSEN